MRCPISLASIFKPIWNLCQRQSRLFGQILFLIWCRITAHEPIKVNSHFCLSNYVLLNLLTDFEHNNLSVRFDFSLWNSIPFLRHPISFLAVGIFCANDICPQHLSMYRHTFENNLYFNPKIWSTRWTICLREENFYCRKIFRYAYIFTQRTTAHLFRLLIVCFKPKSLQFSVQFWRKTMRFKQSIQFMIKSSVISNYCTGSIKLMTLSTVYSNLFELWKGAKQTILTLKHSRLFAINHWQADSIETKLIFPRHLFAVGLHTGIAPRFVYSKSIVWSICFISAFLTCSGLKERYLRPLISKLLLLLVGDVPYCWWCKWFGARCSRLLLLLPPHPRCMESITLLLSAK